MCPELGAGPDFARLGSVVPQRVMKKRGLVSPEWRVVDSEVTPAR